MSVIKLRALERLREVIEREVKDLRGNICAGPAARDHKLSFPSLAIVTGRFTFVPHQADERDHVRNEDRSFGPKTAVLNVGTWDGFVELRLGEKTPRRRYALEHELEQVFLGNADGTAPDAKDIAGAGWMRPGIIIIDIPDCDNARCAFELDSDSWEDEKVFSNQWYSSMRVRASIPALVRAKGIPDMDTVILQLTEDLDTAVADIPTADIEAVQVSEDGTTSPV